jgi:hypothetical protein
MSAEPTARPEWMLLAAEGKARGFRNALAFRRWLKSHGVPIHKAPGEKAEWVRTSDVEAANDARFPRSAPAAPDLAAAAAASVARSAGGIR